MRNLTITRQKSFVACLATMKVYIEDAVAGDLAIKIYVKDEATGMPAQKEMRCRKLGVIKNGETATFSIGDEQAKVIVIADKLSKNYCNEYYTVPEGQEDVVLTGKNVFNPASGNAFQFDGVTDEVVLENRKKGTKKDSSSCWSRPSWALFWALHSRLECCPPTERPRSFRARA